MPEHISEDRMQVCIINRSPACSPVQREAMLAEVENRLFAVFSRYEARQQKLLHGGPEHV